MEGADGATLRPVLLSRSGTVSVGSRDRHYLVLILPVAYSQAQGPQVLHAPGVPPTGVGASFNDSPGADKLSQKDRWNFPQVLTDWTDQTSYRRQETEPPTSADCLSSRRRRPLPQAPAASPTGAGGFSRSFCHRC
jgi:hypothetical protein